ncbi:hypothetical protein EVAR_92473_1 [Eumeta japonica]|uniref:Uncharacterized protein n=1 Tax=Eumeta variegata TaxID=151549 RepID=A0A4C1T6X5_EUMVA|nr:hypothetical protein EVAR_92473_1 [Eumeta japonica]
MRESGGGGHRPGRGLRRGEGRAAATGRGPRPIDRDAGHARAPAPRQHAPALDHLALLFSTGFSYLTATKSTSTLRQRANRCNHISDIELRTGSLAEIADICINFFRAMFLVLLTSGTPFWVDSISYNEEGAADLLRDSVHVTSAAARPPNELWCYRCFADDATDACATDLKHNNNSALIHKCTNDRRLCMVKRFSYTTSTENSTSNLRMWALERNCTKHCEPGCIIIGERTKLYACTSCCETSLCNHGSAAGRATSLPLLYMMSQIMLALVNPL